MQSPVQDMSLAVPNGVAKAYGSVIRRVESPREIESRVFEQVTAGLQAALAPDAHFTLRIEAAHRNRELWLACDLASEDNALPDEARARLLSVRVVHHGAPTNDLIAINRSIMQGLSPLTSELS